MRWLCFAFWLAAPFWETKKPEQWSIAEVELMLSDSPWARLATTTGNRGAYEPVIVHLATAKPVREAAKRFRLQQEIKTDPLYEDYLVWLEEHAATHIVIAVPVTKPLAMADAAEIRNMEKESRLIANGKKYSPVFHFPPSSSDGTLRIAFPRPPAAGKSLVFELYLPSVSLPYRQVEFPVKELIYRGREEY